MHRTLVWAVSLALSLQPPPALATSGHVLLPPPPCPDWSTRLPYGRVQGRVVQDGSGGAFVTWIDDRAVVVQRFDRAGGIVPGWSSLGFHPGWGGQSFLTSDGSRGALVTWVSTLGEVRLQRVLSDAGLAAGWPSDGIVLCDLGEGRFPAIARTGTGGSSVVAAWRLQETNGTQTIRAARVSLTGEPDRRWPRNGLVVATGEDIASRCEVLTDGQGGALVSWLQSDSLGSGTYLQRITASGSIAEGWPPSGLRVADTPHSGAFDDMVDRPSVVPDDRGGAFLVWSGERRAAGSLELDLLAQHVDGKGRLAWPYEGAIVSNAGGDQHLVQAVSDLRGGVLLTWFDDGISDGIRAGRLDARGFTPWGGLVETPSIESLAITSDGREGAFVAWTTPDETPGVPLLAHWNRARGGRRIAVEESPGAHGWDPRALGLASDGRGGVIVVWPGLSKDRLPDRALVRIGHVAAP